MRSKPDATKLKVFLSHKEIDQNTAKQIASALRIKGGMSIEVSISGEQPGIDYRKWIEDKLEQADWYILAFTEPAKNWDWCLYEAGYFEAAKKRDQGPFRIICMHPGDVRPKPLDKFDSVSINNPDKLGRFCEEFLERINPALSLDDKLAARTDLEKLVGDAFKNLMQNRYRGRHITITVPHPMAMGSNDLPDDAMISGAPRIMADIFSFNRECTTWSQAKTTPAAKRDPRWVVQLAHGIANIRHGQFPTPITGQIQTKDQFTQLLPVLNRVDEMEDQSYRCEILLAEGISSKWAELKDENIRALVTSLRMTVRFRYDVLDAFSGHSGRLKLIVNAKSPKHFREHFRNLLFDITSEARANGLSSRHLLVECFDDAQERAEVAKMYEEWEAQIFPKLMLALGMSIDPEVWTTFDDTQFTDDEIDLLAGYFNRMRELNTRYLDLALNRYRELIIAGNA